MSEKLVFTPADLCVLLSIGRGKAYSIARRIGLKDDGRLFISREVLLAWLRRKRTEKPKKRKNNERSARRGAR